MSSKIIDRTEITDPYYKLMLMAERNHKHPIIEDEDGKLYWMPDVKVQAAIDKIGIGKIMDLFDAMGLMPSNETVRDMYRKNGYSLLGYWEIFYYDDNSYLKGKPESRSTTKK